MKSLGLQCGTNSNPGMNRRTKEGHLRASKRERKEVGGREKGGGRERERKGGWEVEREKGGGRERESSSGHVLLSTHS